MTDKGNEIKDSIYGAALLSLTGMGPSRLRRLTGTLSFKDALMSLKERDPKYLADIMQVSLNKAVEFKSGAARLGASDIQAMHNCHLDIDISVLGDCAYPKALAQDLEPPLILFSKGRHKPQELDLFHTVGIVGTRSCTRYGSDIAFELGMELSKAGVVVVSGLASGIDASAHKGALAAAGAPAAGVIGCGLDIVYPKSSRTLYESISQEGVLISEFPLGTRPERWRFPARNRIIAGISDLIIVVESHLKGGALLTAEEAGLRGVSVMAVPGSIRNPSSAGTNHLIAEGCQPLCRISDVFAYLDLVKPSGFELGFESKLAKSQEPQDSTEKKLLDAFCWEVVGLEALVSRSELKIRDLALALESLISQGLVARRGLEFERIAIGAQSE